MSATTQSTTLPGVRHAPRTAGRVRNLDALSRRRSLPPETRALRQALSRATRLFAVASAVSGLALVVLSPSGAPALAALAVAEVVLSILISYAVRRVRRRYVVPLVATVVILVIPARFLSLAFLDSPRPVTLTYLELVPLLVALLIPWSERAHGLWLIYVTAFGAAFAASPLASVLPGEQRLGLVLSLVATSILSLYGHRLLARSRAREFTERRRLRSFNARLQLGQKERDELNRQLAETARRDQLTGLANRRCFDEDLAEAWEEGASGGPVYAVVLLDLDRFKGINDRSHLIGDATLKAVAQALQRTSRVGDVVYRWGGEEFALLLSGVTLETATLASDRLRLAVLGLGIDHPENAPWPVLTISAGVAALASKSDASADDVVRRADAALYRAKSAGRNRVEGELASLRACG